jgi:phosphatidylinositol alpha-1,6-mannosyltransferase
VILLASAVDDEPRGGIPVVNHLVMDACRREGRELVVASLHDRPDAAWPSRWPGSRVAGGSRTRFVRDCLALGARGRDSILATHAGLAPLGRMAAIRGGGALRVFLHGVEVWRPLPFRTLWGLRGAACVIANSAWTLARFREANPDAAALPGAVCHLPARDLPAHPDPAAAAPRREGEVRLLVVGRLWGRGLEKGQDLLVRLLPELRRRVPGATLRIVGEGEGRAALEDLARDRGAGDAVTFTGAVSDDVLDAEYRSADVYAMPSRGEGFGLVFAEAMARGLPCLASRVDAGRELVTHGVTGLLADPGEPEEVLASLERLAGDASLRRRLGRAARADALERFSPEAFRRRILSLVDGGPLA